MRRLVGILVPCRPLVCALLLAALVLGSAPSGAQELAEQPIDITADQVVYEQERGLYEASGNVRIEQPGGRLMTADWLTVNQKTQIGIAVGNVTIRDGDDVVRAEFAAVDVRTLQAVATQASLDTPVGLKVTGAAVERTGESTYRVEDGTFTACRCPPGKEREPWQVDIGEADIEVGGYAVARDVKFRILDIPVVYVPWLILPVKTERQTGFLVPSVGSTSRGGTEVELPFFWAARHDLNLLFRPQWIDKRGVKTAVELEYLLGESGTWSGGLAYLTNDDEVDDDPDKRFSSDRSAYWLDVDQPLPWSLRFGADVTRVSDNNYPIDFEDLKDEARNARFLHSSLFVTGAERGFYTGVQATAFDDLQSPNDVDRDDFLLRKLPDVHLQALSRQLGPLPLWAGLDARYTYFHQPGQKTLFGSAANAPVQGRFFDTGLDGRFNADEELIPLGPDPHLDDFGLPGGTEGDGLFQEGELLADDGHRGELYPTLTLPFRFGPLETLSELGYRATFYSPDEGDTEARGLWTGRFDARARFMREFLLGGRAVNHIVEPSVTFAYISDDDQDTNPLFIPEHSVTPRRLINKDVRVLLRNPSDRVAEERLVIAALSNRLYAPGASASRAPRLVGTFRLGGGYDLEDSQASTLFADASFQPNENISFVANVGYDPKESETTEATASLLWRSDRIYRLPSSMSDRRHELALTYRYLRDIPLFFEAWQRSDDVFDEFERGLNRIDQLNLEANVALLRQVDVFLRGYTSLEESSTNGGTLGFAFLSACACWELIASVDRRTRPDDTRFQVEVRLAGLGFKPLRNRAELVRSRGRAVRSVDGSDSVWESPPQ